MFHHKFPEQGEVKVLLGEFQQQWAGEEAPAEGKSGHKERLRAAAFGKQHRLRDRRGDHLYTIIRSKEGGILDGSQDMEGGIEP